MIDVRIQDCELVEGYYSLGFFQEHYREIEWVVHLGDIDETVIEKLKTKINHGLANGKKVALVLWDENFIGQANKSFTFFLNSYIDKPVWLITQLNPKCQQILTFQQKIRCKILELPWWWLNDTLVYYQVCKSTEKQQIHSYNYMCMIGRIDRHKLNLVRELEKQQLDQYGFISFLKPMEEFKNNTNVKINSVRPYLNCDTEYEKMAAQVCHETNDGKEKIWISGNVENFLHIQDRYSDIPLVVHPESSVGIFFDTEKSLWPLLLGKMVLCYGGPGVMRSIQRFYDFDISRYADLSFDTVYDYTSNGETERLQTLLNDNRDLIINAPTIYSKFQPELESARWSIGKNLLDFCHKQVKTILNKEN